MLRIIKERIERQTEIIVMPLNTSILDLTLEYCVWFLPPPFKRLWWPWKRPRLDDRRLVRNSGSRTEKD